MDFKDFTMRREITSYVRTTIQINDRGKCAININKINSIKMHNKQK